MSETPRRSLGHSVGTTPPGVPHLYCLPEPLSRFRVHYPYDRDVGVPKIINGYRPKSKKTLTVGFSHHFYLPIKSPLSPL